MTLRIGPGLLLFVAVSTVAGGCDRNGEQSSGQDLPTTKSCAAAEPLALGARSVSLKEPKTKLARLWSGVASSCRNLPATCGPSKNESCCMSLVVPGGTFARSYDGVDYRKRDYAAAVSAFYMDKYEVTVGRLRAFVNAGAGTQKSPPASGAGAHPRIPGSGWRNAWNDRLRADTSGLRAALKCYVHHTWTDIKGENEHRPANCLDWYMATAFCAWDGGRLSTEAEWNYAASGGDEHRYYPWSVPPTATTIDDTYAVFCGGTCEYADVGSRSPKGDGRFGHADLGGNAWEWNLDWDPVEYEVPCNDCARIAPTKYANKSVRSGSNDDIAPTLRSATRHVHPPSFRLNIGVRCARDP